MKLLTFKLFIIGAFLVASGCQESDVSPAARGMLVPKTVDQDPALPQLHINGTRLHVESYGNPSNPMIVVLHGGPGGDFRSMLKCKAFASDGYHVVFYDQRGSGLSQRHQKGIYNMAVMVNDLQAIIRHHRQAPDQKVFLLGQSWGAMLATAYINEYPAEISGAILSEPGGFNWEDVSEYISRSREANPLSEQMNDVFYIDQFITGKPDEHELLDYKMALTTVHENADGNPLGNGGSNPFWRFGAIVQARLMEIGRDEGFQFSTHVHQFNSPVLFLYSELNRAYGEQYARKVSSVYPHVELKMIRNSGHEIPWFGWEEYYPTVLNYLNALK